MIDYDPDALLAAVELLKECGGSMAMENLPEARWLIRLGVAEEGPFDSCWRRTVRLKRNGTAGRNLILPEPDEGIIHVVSPPEFVGKIPVRSELTVLPADDPSSRQIGFAIFETVGTTIVNNAFRLREPSVGRKTFQVEPRPPIHNDHDYFIGIDLGLRDESALVIGHFETNYGLGHDMRLVVDEIERLPAHAERTVQQVAGWVAHHAKKYNIVKGYFDQWCGAIFERELDRIGLSQIEGLHETRTLRDNMVRCLMPALPDQKDEADALLRMNWAAVNHVREEDPVRVVGPAGLAALADAFVLIERQDCRVGTVKYHPAMRLPTAPMFEECVDDGKTIWGATLEASREVPKNEIWVESEALLMKRRSRIVIA
jgi:hypothetical protein